MKQATSNSQFFMVDSQNSHDPWAVALRTSDPIALVDFCPRYFAQTFRSLLERHDLKVEVIVEQVNLDAPTQLRLLCRLTAPWPEDFRPCSEEQCEPLVQLESPRSLCLARVEHRV